MAYSKIKKALGLNPKGRFNFEGKNDLSSELEKGMIVDRTNYQCLENPVFAPYWQKMSDEQKGNLINFLARPDVPSKGLSIEEQDELSGSIHDQFKNELNQLYDKSVSEEEKQKIRKTIRDIARDKKENIIHIKNNSVDKSLKEEPKQFELF